MIFLSLGVLICLSQHSQSWYSQNVSLDSWEYLNSFKKLVSSIKKFWSRSRNIYSFLKLDRIDIYKHGGLDLSRSCLNQDSWSRYRQNVSLDSWENHNSFKKLVSIIDKFWSRLRNLDFVLMLPSSPKSLNQDREICWDLKFLVKQVFKSNQWNQFHILNYFSLQLLPKQGLG